MPAQWCCPTCLKVFQRKGDLTRHQHLHTGYRPHVCDKCGKAFAQYTGLKTHRNVHTRERPYQCTICSASFSDPSSCARHKRETHVNPMGYKCSFPGCKTSIKRRSCFVKHLKEKHGFDYTDIKIETDVPVLPDDLYQMSSPESSTTSPSSSDSSVDVIPWEGANFQAPSAASETGDFEDGLVLFAKSSWASLPSDDSGVHHDKSMTSFSYDGQVDLPQSLTTDTTTFFNPLYSDQMYEYLQWAGSPFTQSSSSSICSSVRSSPSPSTPELPTSNFMSDMVATRYNSQFVHVRSGLAYAYTPSDLENFE